NYKPSEPYNIFIEDFGDWANGGASAVPRNFVYVSIAPYLYVFDVAPANERMSLLMHHELVHVIAMDKATRRDNFWRKLYCGKVQQTATHPVSMLYAYQTTPRKFSPRWYHEGIAVFMETWMGGGVGRALGAYDEMVFRTLVHDSAYIYHLVGLESEGTAIDFQVGANSYLYGTRFFNYLASQYGPDKVIQWVSRTPDSRRYFSKQFKRVFGQPVAEEWSRWIDFEKDWQKQNLTAIRKYPETAFQPIIHDRILGSVSRSFLDSTRNLLYTGVKFPGQIAHIAAIDLKSGRLEKICDIKGASTYYTTNLLFDPSSDRLFFTTDNYKYRDLNCVCLKDHKATRLITDVRTGDLAFDPADKSIWGVRHENGISTLVRIRSPYKDYSAVHAFQYGTDLYDLDISPDGKYLTGAMTFVDGKQKLVCFEVAKLLNHQADYEELFDFELTGPANFVFSADGRYLYGTSYYSGVSNVYRYDFNARDMSIISNTETGFFRPVPVNADSLIAFQYSARGFVPGWIPNRLLDNVAAIRYLGQTVYEKYPVVGTWQAESPAKIDLDSITTYKGIYKLWPNTRLKAAYPMVEGYKSTTALGYYFDFSNDIGFNSLHLSASYSPFNDSLSKGERFHFSANYHYWKWEFNFKYNPADFYDLCGPTRTSRRGYFLGTKYSNILIWDEPRTMGYTLTGGYWGGLEKMPDFQNVSASFDRYLYFNLDLNYEYIERSLGAVDGEKGYLFNVFSRNNYVNWHLFPQIVTTFDRGFALPLDHTSIWLRSAAGLSPALRKEPFANFYFGGFGNNWIDHQDEKRYREYYSFPGAGLNSIGGTNFVKLMTDLNLPPLRFRHIGIPALYPRWLRTSVFATGLSTNLLAPSINRTVFNCGTQVDMEIVLFSLFKTTLSAGYGVAIENDRKPTDEWMFSLKIL
ncbi:MAG: hypothetical protein V1681_01340, partial [Candidatus Neomarinimicrobiota bacterium]